MIRLKTTPMLKKGTAGAADGRGNYSACEFHSQLPVPQPALISGSQLPTEISNHEP